MKYFAALCLLVGLVAVCLGAGLLPDEYSATTRWVLGFAALGLALAVAVNRWAHR